MSNHVRLSTRVVAALLLAAGLLSASPTVQAWPEYGAPWDTLYSPSLSHTNSGCALCHTTVDPNRSSALLNPYGTEMARNLTGTSEAQVLQALQAIEVLDSDNDPGDWSNLAEITANTQPGWKAGDNPAGVTGALDPAPPADTTPPSVTASFPLPGAVGVSTAVAVTATFSEALDAATVNVSTFVLRDGVGNIVPATVGYAAGTATLSPTSALAVLSTYTATLFGGTTGVKDLAGNPLSANYVWSFTTAAAPDTTPPVVTAVSPTAGATRVSTTAAVTATFSEAIDAATVSAATFVLRDGGGTLVPATVSYDAGTLSATLTPASGLAFATTYSATVIGGTAGVKDLGGNPLQTNFVWTFTTESASPLAFSSGTLNFFEPTLAIGNASAPRSFTVTNVGDQVVLISAVTVGGPAGTEFSHTTSCVGSLAVGAFCEVSVTFTPAAAGVRIGEIAFTTDLSTGPRRIGLIGNRGAGAFVDFSGDGRDDVLWRHGATGENYVWVMEGLSRIGGGPTLTVSELGWTIERVGDFNGDGKSDVFWRHRESGATYVWLMEGTAVIGAGPMAVVPDLNWRVVGAGDFNADGKADILWRHALTGENFIWLLDGVVYIGGGAAVTVPDVNWVPERVADLNADGRSDIFWRHRVTRATYVWLMEGTAVIGAGPMPFAPELNWRVVGAGDFNADGKADILWRHALTGENFIWLMNGLLRLGAGAAVTVADVNWVVEQVSDFNADGRSDIFWRHRESGETFLWLMDGTGLIGAGPTVPVPDLSWEIVP